MTLINQLLRETLDASVLEGIKTLRVGGEERKEKIISEMLSRTEKERAETKRYIGMAYGKNAEKGYWKYFERYPIEDIDLETMYENEVTGRIWFNESGDINSEFYSNDRIKALRMPGVEISREDLEGIFEGLCFSRYSYNSEDILERLSMTAYNPQTLVKNWGNFGAGKKWLRFAGDGGPKTYQQVQEKWGKLGI